MSPTPPSVAPRPPARWLASAPTWPAPTALAALLTTALLAAGCGSEQQQHQRPPSPVRVEVVSTSEVPLETEYVATIRSRDAAEVRSQVTGRVLAIHVRPGDEVTVGENIIDIDPSRQQAAVDSARAATDAASASLERAQADLEALRAQQEADQADVEYARQQRDRIRELFAADNASRQEYDQATADLRRAEAQLGVVEAQISAQEATVRSQRAAVAQSRSGVAEGQAELDHYDVEAPIAGVLGDIPVRIGDLVTPSTPLTTVQGRQGLEVYLQVPVEQLPRLRLGEEIQLLDQARDVLTTTHVDFIAPAVDPVTQTILVKAPLDPATPLTNGSFVHARLVWDRLEGPTVPTTAVKRINTQPFVFVLREGEQTTVEQRPVRLGQLRDQRYLVLDGLQPGETVVVAGIQRIGDGAPVAVETDEGQGPVDGETASRAEAARGGTGVPE